MKFTTENYVKNTEEARELLVSRGNRPCTKHTFDKSYLTITSYGFICGSNDKAFVENVCRKELYAYNNDFHEAPKHVLSIEQHEKIASYFGRLSSGKTEIKHYEITVSLKDIIEACKNKGFSIREFSKENKPDFSRYGYKEGYVWVYNPNDDNGSFHDVDYTRKWRYIHELSHALTYDTICTKYDIDKVERGSGALAYDKALIAMDWELEAMRTQFSMLDGVLNNCYISPEQKAREINTLMYDLTIRCLTGEFTNPDEMGFIPNDTFFDWELDSLKRIYNG
jgi:hypothetical protein